MYIRIFGPSGFHQCLSVVIRLSVRDQESHIPCPRAISSRLLKHLRANILQRGGSVRRSPDVGHIHDRIDDVTTVIIRIKVELPAYVVAVWDKCDACSPRVDVDFFDEVGDELLHDVEVVSLDATGSVKDEDEVDLLTTGCNEGYVITYMDLSVAYLHVPIQVLTSMAVELNRNLCAGIDG